MTTPNQLRLALWMGVVVTGAVAGQLYTSIAYETVPQDILETLPGLRAGAMISGLASAFELFVMRGEVVGWFRRQTFLGALFARIVVHSAIVIGGLTGNRLLSALLVNRIDPTAFVAQELIQDGIFAFVVTGLALFVLQMRTLIGGRTLINVVLGRYHRPVREERLFLLVDLTDSTRLAENLGDERFHEYLSAFFFEVDAAVADQGGEIHSYVGDAMIASWLLRSPRRNARAVAALVNLRQRVAERTAWFVATYGQAPRFRAILHGGPIVAGECGDSRRQITYLGDVLNTTGRLEAFAKKLDIENLASRQIIEKIELPDTIGVEDLGSHPLKGRHEAIALVSLRIGSSVNAQPTPHAFG